MEARLARVISFLFHPLVIPTLVLLMVQHSDVFVHRPVAAVYQWLLAGIVFLITFVMPLALTWLLYKLGIIRSAYLNEREERAFPIMTIALFYYVTYYIFRGTHLSAIFTFYMLGATLLAILGLGISFFHKISLHMMAAGSLTGLFLGLTLNFGIDFRAEIPATILLAGVIGFARLKAGTHRTAEIYTGYTLGVVTITGLMLLL
jgi:hypothetical protein